MRRFLLAEAERRLTQGIDTAATEQSIERNSECVSSWLRYRRWDIRLH